MSIPVISFSALSNYAAALQVGTVVERAALQATFTRINNHLLNDFAGRTLSLTVSPMNKDTAGAIIGTAKSDEVYLLNDTSSSVVRRILIKDEDGKIVRSVVLALTDGVVKELFGNTASELFYDCVVDNYMRGELCTSELLSSDPIFSYAIEPNLVVCLPNGDWVTITNYSNDGLQHRSATEEEIKAAGITPGFPNVITKITSPVKQFTNDKGEWLVPTGVKRDANDKEISYTLTTRPATAEEAAKLNAKLAEEDAAKVAAAIAKMPAPEAPKAEAAATVKAPEAKTAKPESK